MSDTPTDGPQGDQPEGDRGSRPRDHRGAKSRLRRRKSARRVVVGATVPGTAERSEGPRSSLTTPEGRTDSGKETGPAARTAESETSTGAAATTAAPAPDAEPARSTVEAGGEGPAPPAPDGSLARRALAGLSRPVVVAVTVLLLAATTTTAVLGWQVLQANRVDEAQTAALAAGSEHVKNVLSYDYRHLDKDSASAEEALTPDFWKEYERTTEDVVAPTARQIHAVVSARVVESSVVEAETDRVVLLMFVNRQVTRDGLDGPKIDLERVRATLTPVDDEWRIDDLDLL